VLLLVLGLTVLMLIGAAAVYSASDSHRMAFGQVRAEAVAVMNAEKGAQDTVAVLRTGVTTLSTPYLACPQFLITPNRFCDGVYLSYDGPLNANGSPDYQIVIYKRTVQGFSRSSTVVSSTGLSAGLTSPNLVTARFEVEVQTPVTSTMGNSIAGGS
jgi:Tfp pilus assembly protein PilX